MVETNPYSGTSALVVEYDDLIRSPMFEVIKHNRKNPSLREILDLSEIEYLYDPGVYEWYKQRRHRNPLMDLHPREDVDEEYLNNVMRVFLEKHAGYTDSGRTLEFVDCIRYTISQHFKMDYYVYSEFGNPFVMDDMRALFPDVQFSLLEGDFAKAISEIPMDTTWGFSDITKVNILEETNHLDFSGVMLGLSYRYNYKDDEPGETKVDISSLKEIHPFKYTAFNVGKFTDDEVREILGKERSNALDSIMPDTNQ